MILLGKLLDPNSSMVRRTPHGIDDKEEGIDYHFFTIYSWPMHDNIYIRLPELGVKAISSGGSFKQQQYLTKINKHRYKLNKYMNKLENSR
jgi:hypothetical protein